MISKLGAVRLFPNILDASTRREEPPASPDTLYNGIHYNSKHLYNIK